MSRRPCSNLHQIGTTSKSATLPARGDRPATARLRCDPRFTMLSSKWTSHQVDQTPRTEAFGDLPQLRGAGHKESAKQTIAAKPLHPGLPVLGARTHPLADPGQLRRDRRLSLAIEPARVLNQPHSSSRNHRRPRRRYRRVLRDGFRVTSCSRRPPPPARMPCERSAICSDISALRSHQPTWLERSPLEISWGYTLLYAMPVDLSTSCPVPVVKNHHRDRSSQHHLRAAVAESACLSVHLQPGPKRCSLGAVFPAK
jgi:hypothetical protein